MTKTYQQEIGELVTLALSCPSAGHGLAGGSKAEERAQDEWARRVHVEATRLHKMVLGHDPKAIRLIEAVRAETPRP